MDRHILRVFTWIRSHKFVIDVNIFFVMINPDKLFIYVINVQLYIIHDMCRTRLSKEIIIIIDMTKEIIYRLVVLKKCHEQWKFPFFCVCLRTCAVSHSKEKQSKVSHCTFSVVKKRETMRETTNLHVCSNIFFPHPRIVRELIVFTAASSDSPHIDSSWTDFNIILTLSTKNHSTSLPSQIQIQLHIDCANTNAIHESWPQIFIKQTKLIPVELCKVEATSCVNSLNC